MAKRKLTAKQVSERLNKPIMTVRRWLQKGLFPNAEKLEIPPYGETWQIPESDLKKFEEPEIGRPKKKKPE